SSRRIEMNRAAFSFAASLLALAASAFAGEPFAGDSRRPVTRDQLAEAFNSSPMSSLDALGESADWQLVAFVASARRPGTYDPAGVAAGNNEIGLAVERVPPPDTPLASRTAGYFFSWIYRGSTGDHRRQTSKAALTLEDGSARHFIAGRDVDVTDDPAISCGNCPDDPGPQTYTVHRPWRKW